MARPVDLGGLNDSRFTHRLYHCDPPFYYTIKLRTVCSGEVLPITPFPSKIDKRPSLKLCSCLYRPGSVRLDTRRLNNTSLLHPERKGEEKNKKQEKREVPS